MEASSVISAGSSGLLGVVKTALSSSAAEDVMMVLGMNYVYMFYYKCNQWWRGRVIGHSNALN